ncbi:MAG: hypothetical protein SFU57_08970 [Gemmatimonadales bacterium]|nr:hypothetical protein [Gemmatimonadales bacterium]
MRTRCFPAPHGITPTLPTLRPLQAEIVPEPIEAYGRLAIPPVLVHVMLQILHDRHHLGTLRLEPGGIPGSPAGQCRKRMVRPVAVVLGQEFGQHRLGLWRLLG